MKHTSRALEFATPRWIINTFCVSLTVALMGSLVLALHFTRPLHQMTALAQPPAVQARIIN